MENTTVSTSFIAAQVEELNQMIQQGQIIDAFNKFYANDIVLQENEDEPTIGKANGLLKEEAFVGNLTDFRKAEIQSVVVGDRLSVVQWSFDFTHAEWGVRNYNQISVQRWNDEGQIIHERHHYNS